MYRQLLKARRRRRRRRRGGEVDRTGAVTGSILIVVIRKIFVLIKLKYGLKMSLGLSDY
jgi:hypothetical protein